MSVDDQELRAIAFLALRVRKATHGCGPWDEHGLVANLIKLRHWNLHLLIEHVIRHAADPKAKTPGVLLGSFTPPAPTGGQPHRPLKAREQCRRCGGAKGGCGCTREDLAEEHDEAPDLPPLDDVNPRLAGRIKTLLGEETADVVPE